MAVCALAAGDQGEPAAVPCCGDRATALCSQEHRAGRLLHPQGHPRPGDILLLEQPFAYPPRLSSSFINCQLVQFLNWRPCQVLQHEGVCCSVDSTMSNEGGWVWQVPLLALHTAPWNWPQPERFWPERWTTPELRGGPKAGTEGLASAFLPCGASCISSHVAEAQASLLASPASQVLICAGQGAMCSESWQASSNCYLQWC